MRTWRAVQIATITLALLGATATTGMAQTESDTASSDESALLSFRMVYPALTGDRTSTPGEGRILHRDQSVMTFILSGDPRLDGTLRMVWNWDEFDDSRGNVLRGIASIDHDDGAWRGPVRGYFTPGREQKNAQIDLTGEGAYEGLSAVLFLIDAGNTTEFDVGGMIFPGDPPPIPAAPAE